MKTVIALGVAAALLATGAAASSGTTRHSIPATANIFGAGFTVAPQPGGGGAGRLPPVWHLPRGSSRVVTFSRITGSVTPIREAGAYNGAGGDKAGATDVDSWNGISGIIHRRNGMFLVGVFLAEGRPQRPAPPRLDFTNRERFSLLAPLLGQTFFVGDGKGRSYRVPPKATRLFLGFADGYYYRGKPGWYGNNAGSLAATVKVTTR